MSLEDFNHFIAQGFARIPVVRRVLADLETPLSTYLKLAKGPNSYLLESVQGGEKWGRYSIIGLPCRELIRVTGQVLERERDGQVIESLELADPLTYIENYAASQQAPSLPGMPRFTGGLVGYFGYDTIRYIEPRLGPCRKPDELQQPDILLMLSDEVVVFDNLTGELFVVVHAAADVPGAYSLAQTRLDALCQKLREPLPYPHAGQTQSRPVREQDFISSFGREAFEAAVEKCKDYIAAGDLMQVVLSQRLAIDYHAPSLDLYRALRSLNPSPYMYFVDFGETQIVGSSPEILVRLEQDKVTVRPIAGTRRRGYDEAEDQALERELLADPKEIAEHLMLIDLGRNDASRVSEIGSVKLTETMQVERYSHVMHIVSNVEGRLLPSKTSMDVLRATFPAGTVSGAPKVRAMEIIDELEPVKRGIYSGALGYLSFTGQMDTAIAIRTAVINQGKLYVQAGAGIVADSRPDLEWKETMNKARALFRAVAMAEFGLDRL